MSFVVSKIEDKRYILLEFENIASASEFEQCRTALMDVVGKSEGYRKALVDMRNASLNIRAVDVHQFISSHGDELPLGCLIALIMRPEDWNTAIFVEKTAHDHGIYLRVFQNDTPACAWLGPDIQVSV
jgi:hypothetical protein